MRRSNEESNLSESDTRLTLFLIVDLRIPGICSFDCPVRSPFVYERKLQMAFSACIVYNNIITRCTLYFPTNCVMQGEKIAWCRVADIATTLQLGRHAHEVGDIGS